MHDPFGVLLWSLRQRHALKLGDVAERLGVTVVQVSSWERGRERPTDAQVVALHPILSEGHLSRATLFDLRDLPMPDWAAIDAARAELASLGLTFQSYAHEEGNPDCPCNDCGMARDVDELGDWPGEIRRCESCGADRVSGSPVACCAAAAAAIHGLTREPQP